LVFCSQGEWVWVDSDIGVPIGARVKETPSGRRFLVNDEGKEESLSPELEASVKIMHPTSVEGVDDMIKLGDMTEAGILRNLLLRHKQGLIYTYIGSVLVAVNPYQDYPMYSGDQLYQGRKLGELPPHIFAIAESCYTNMMRHHKNQCCIISGESGAGKTESTKLILQYFAAVSGGLSKQEIEHQILESNPILEAFGNAKTIRNDNSSRFGKYLEIFFNKDGVIEGARVEQYLLEKSRVCHQASEERNYHMLYCMLAGITAEEKRTLSLGDAKEYTFLSKGNCIVCDGRDDAKDYQRVLSAMKTLTFSESQCQEILKLLATILHLGNICFEANTQNNLETSDVSKTVHFNMAASLLEVNKSSLGTSLTHRSFRTNRESVTKPLSSEQASDCRDAFVKAIYNKLFIWIVGKINSIIYQRLIKNPKTSFLSIGLLDIFGFENFISNSFEQLCINFANEKLQQFFVGHIFKLEQKEYLKEDIVWKNIKFSDNQNILDLLAGKPCNLLALIDEESHFPKGSDVTMLNKMNKQHKKNKTYIASRSEHDTYFGIHHFAGVVYYDSKGFLEKNRDGISSDIIKMVEMSKNKLLRQIFENELSTNGLKAQGDNRKQVPTLSGQFRQSLDSLMKTLSACHPFFIRCFKPNNDKRSEVFDRELCMRQLRYSGMMDTIRIRRLGYPIRHTFAEFLKRYRVLLKTTDCNPKIVSLSNILTRYLYFNSSMTFGYFLLQVRGYRVRKDWKQKRGAVILLQAHTRGMLDRRVVGKMRKDVRYILKRSITPEPEEEIIPLKSEPVEEIIPPVSISTTPSQSEEDDDEFDDETEEFSFYKFSILHFQGSATHTHISKRLQQSLLHHDDEGDAACVSVNWIILRYMADLPEPKSADATSLASSTISRNVPNRRGRRLSNLVGLDQVTKYPYCSCHLHQPEDLTEDEGVLIGEGPRLQRPLTPVEKLNIIIGYALSRPNIRDEIYCQICKQLVRNNNRNSRMLGWTLLSICLGMFPPTDLFMKYLENFVRKGPNGYGTYCTERLRRINANGERKELPCWEELKAAKSKEPIEVSVTLMDDRTISLNIDSASTSAEVCQALATKIDLRDTYGFSLYISLYDKMWSLGSCGNHVLDAVSQCEQEMTRQGKQEKDTPWKLSIRKELFRPWHDCSKDSISTDLIYRQVIKGIKSGDYTSEKEDEYVHMAAQHYYIQFGSAFNKDNVQKVVDECIATQLIESKSMSKWIQLISTAVLQGPYANGNQRKESVKAELVDNAQQKWPLFFSKFYDVTMTSGPPLPKSRFFVAVNWSGVLFMDGRDKKLLDLPYIEIKEIVNTFVSFTPLLNILIEFFYLYSESYLSAQSVTMDTVRGEFVLASEEAADMAALIDEHLEGLRQYSVYAMAKQDVSKPEDSTFLVFKRGDLLLVERDEHSTNDSWVRATNQRTSNSGTVDKDTVKFLPTLSRPTEDILVVTFMCHTLWVTYDTLCVVLNYRTENETLAPLSLKEFALENFRLAGKDGSRPGPARGFGREKLWIHSREPLKQPLMKSLANNSELSSRACNYMGDYPIKHARSPMELTDQIFGPATQHEVLQDEIYCQIMRQMTGNQSRISLDRGWQLMWLITGLFPPSPGLMGHAQRFLETRPRNQLSNGCLQRLLAMRRKCPPHMVEVDAIQQNSAQIFHKIHFPNDSDDIFEVTSTTTNKDLCHGVASQLKLNSADGYGLYLKTPNKVGIVMTHDLCCAAKQEMPKYLRGYHNCSREDMITLGGLLFRVEVDSDRSQFVMIPRMLRQLVPADQIKSMSPEEWKKHIISSYNKQSGITVQEAKIAFLKAISTWPTFGCAFFEVKQSCEPSYPSTFLIAISKQGVSFIDPQTKELLVMHKFKNISEYYSKGSRFQMTVGTVMKNDFICETSQVRARLLISVLAKYFWEKKPIHIIL
uniref:Myosin VIIBb n=1 Tax=Sparus aurata TaxID=8175 RepID=A0A671VL09_SPAAU